MNKKQEIIKRLKKLQIFKDSIKQFEEDDVLMVSEKMMQYVGVLYWLNDREKEAVKKFEEKYKEYEATFYHGLRIHTNEGPILYMLYFTKDDTFEEFEEDLQHNIARIYCDPLDTSFYHEFGSTYIEPAGGGLIVPEIETQKDFDRLVRFK